MPVVGPSKRGLSRDEGPWARADPRAFPTALPTARSPLVGRSGVVQELLAALRDEGAALVTGTRGVGRTRVLQGLREASPWPIVALNGDVDLTGVPLGVVRPWLADDLDVTEQPLIEIVDALLERWRHHVHGAGLLLVVDDAHLLDPASTHTIRRLALNAAWCRLLVSTPDAALLPAALTSALSSDDVPTTRPAFREITLRPLSGGQVRELAALLLDGPIDPGLAHTLVERCEGRPAILVALLRAALQTQVLTFDLDIWRAVRPLPDLLDTPDMDRLAVGSRARRAAGLVALAGSLPLLVAGHLAQPRAIRELEGAGVVRWQVAGGRPALVLNQPWRSAELRPSGEAYRSALRHLAEAFDRFGATAQDPARVASWRLEVGGGDTSLFDEATDIALAHGDDALAVRLAQASAARGGSFRGQVLLGVAIAASDPPRGQRLLQQAFDEAEGAAQRVLVALELARVHWTVAGRPDLARAGLDRTHAGLDEAADGAELVGLAAVIAAATGDIAPARHHLANLRAAGPGEDVLRLADTTVSLLRDEDPTDLLARGATDETLTTIPPPPGVVPDPARHQALQIAGAIVGLAPEADPDEPTHRRLTGALIGLRRARADGDGAVLGLHLAAVGRLELRTGAVAAAERHLREAADHLDRLDPLWSRPLVLCLIAHAAAQTGTPAAARNSLIDVEAARSRAPRVDAWARCAEAEALAIDAPAEVAIDAAIRAGDAASRGGLYATALAAWEVVLRLGAGQVVCTRLERVTNRSPTAHGRQLTSAATALAAGDAAAVDAAARTFAADGRRLLAAELAVRAAHLGAGERTAALANGLRATCAGVATAQLDPLPLPSLPPATRHVARHVLRGGSTAEVAADLGMSRSTVDNQLARVYRELGVHSRTELAACYPLDVGPLADG